MFILALILSILLGFALAYMGIAYWVYRSNDHGNSAGKFEDFSREPLHIVSKSNHVGKPL